jgi:RNA polymerase sigma-70 factor (ECF subfamily)
VWQLRFACVSEIQVVGDNTERSIDAHYGDVYRFVRRRSATDEDAEDVTQAVFAAAAARMDDLSRDSRPLLAWLYTVARRRLVDEQRRRSRRGQPVELTDEIAAESAEYGSEVRYALARALAGLRDGQREVVVARLIEGQDFEEIGRRLAITETAARMRFSRGLETIRAALESEGVSP